MSLSVSMGLRRIWTLESVPQLPRVPPSSTTLVEQQEVIEETEDGLGPAKVDPEKVFEGISITPSPSFS